MSNEVGAGFLAEDVGVPLRSIQWWTDRGVLIGLPETNLRGRGKHRLYDASPPLYGERVYARVAAELNRLRLPIGVILEVTNSLRREFAAGFVQKRLEQAWVPRALQGEPLVLLIRVEEDADRLLVAVHHDWLVGFRGIPSAHVLNL